MHCTDEGRRDTRAKDLSTEDETSRLWRAKALHAWMCLRGIHGITKKRALQSSDTFRILPWDRKFYHALKDGSVLWHRGARTRSCLLLSSCARARALKAMCKDTLFNACKNLLFIAMAQHWLFGRDGKHAEALREKSRTSKHRASIFTRHFLKQIHL